MYVMAMPWLSIINAAIFGWLCAGIALRKRHGLHAAMMTLGFAFDLALLVYVEFSAKAIEQAVSKPPGALLVIHIVLATVMLVLYPCVIFSGGRVLAGGDVRKHKRLAVPFMIARLLVVITAWLVVRWS